MYYFKLQYLLAAVMLAFLSSCTIQKIEKMTFGDDLQFLKKHLDVVLLSDESSKSQVVVVPSYQGRVMTSTASGLTGLSYGWINRELIASGEIRPHINAFGGEDRFWLGPEGGQFSIFFKPGTPFDLEHWQTPAPIDTEAFEIIAQSKNQVSMAKDMRLENYSGTGFNVHVDRDVKILERENAAQLLRIKPAEAVKMVAYESINKITNTGNQSWQEETGLLSIWILGMFNPSPTTTVVIPFHPGPDSVLGPVVNDAYFGQVPPQRLVVKDSVLFFSGDGRFRSKIGLSPQRARSILGSYDASNQVLTIVQFNKPDSLMGYVNSMWEIQEHPYQGDVVNSYNDGPPSPGAKPLGPFYELETSSPAAALQPGGTLVHVHRTIHFQGEESDLAEISLAVLGVSIKEIKKAFKK